MSAFISYYGNENAGYIRVVDSDIRYIGNLFIYTLGKIYASEKFFFVATHSHDRWMKLEIKILSQNFTPDDQEYPLINKFKAIRIVGSLKRK